MSFEAGVQKDPVIGILADKNGGGTASIMGAPDADFLAELFNFWTLRFFLIFQ